MANEVVAFTGVPLRPVLDQTPPSLSGSREKAIQNYVNTLTSVSPALDRDTVRKHVIDDLDKIADGRINTQSSLWWYRWDVINGQLAVSFK